MVLPPESVGKASHVATLLLTCATPNDRGTLDSWLGLLWRSYWRQLSLSSAAEKKRAATKDFSKAIRARNAKFRVRSGPPSEEQRSDLAWLAHGFGGSTTLFVCEDIVLFVQVYTYSLDDLDDGRMLLLPSKRLRSRWQMRERKQKHASRGAVAGISKEAPRKRSPSWHVMHSW